MCCREHVTVMSEYRTNMCGVPIYKLLCVKRQLFIVCTNESSRAAVNFHSGQTPGCRLSPKVYCGTFGMSSCPIQTIEEVKQRPFKGKWTAVLNILIRFKLKPKAAQMYLVYLHITGTQGGRGTSHWVHILTLERKVVFDFSKSVILCVVLHYIEMNSWLSKNNDVLKLRKTF